MQVSVRTMPARRRPQLQLQARRRPPSLSLVDSEMRPALRHRQARLQPAAVCSGRPLNPQPEDQVCSARPLLLRQRGLFSGQNQQRQVRLNPHRLRLLPQHHLVACSEARLRLGPPHRLLPRLPEGCSTLGPSLLQLLPFLLPQRQTPRNLHRLDFSGVQQLLEVCSVPNLQRRLRPFPRPRPAHPPHHQEGSLPASVKSQQKRPSRQSHPKRRRRFLSAARRQVAVSLAPNQLILHPPLRAPPRPLHLLHLEDCLLALHNLRTHRRLQNRPKPLKPRRPVSPSLAIPRRQLLAPRPQRLVERNPLKRRKPEASALVI